MNPPTSDQCGNNEIITDENGDRWLATWYPQMGGYVGHCLVRLPSAERLDAGEDCANECFDVYVWHDGEWPFDGDEDRQPACLHHCSVDQFIRFGQRVAKAQGRREEKTKP